MHEKKSRHGRISLRRVIQKLTAGVNTEPYNQGRGFDPSAAGVWCFIHKAMVDFILS